MAKATDPVGGEIGVAAAGAEGLTTEVGEVGGAEVIEGDVVVIEGGVEDSGEVLTIGAGEEDEVGMTGEDEVGLTGEDVVDSIGGDAVTVVVDADLTGEAAATDIRGVETEVDSTREDSMTEKVLEKTILKTRRLRLIR